MGLSEASSSLLLDSETSCSKFWSCVPVGWAKSVAA
jgi:hypothetical protein